MSDPLWYTPNMLCPAEEPPLPEQFGDGSGIISDFVATLFQNTRSIVWAHNHPRFGHGSDMNVLLEGTQEQKADYVKGLVATSILLFIGFLLWMMMLLIFKCLGPEKVGFLSGRRVPLSPRPASSTTAITKTSDTATSSDQDDTTAPSKKEQQSSNVNRQRVVAWDKQYRQVQMSNRRMKVAVIFACLCIMICSILLTVFGANTLLVSIDEGTETIAIATGLMENAINVTDTTLERMESLERTKVELVGQLNTYCPAARDEICTDLTQVPESCNFEDLSPGGDAVRRALNFFVNLELDIVKELRNVKSDLEDQLKIAQNLEEAANEFNWALYVSETFALLLSVVLLLIMLGAFCPKLPNVLQCLRHWLAIPIFVLLVVIAWIFSMVFVIGSMSLADFCIDSPDDTVLLLLDSRRKAFSSLVYEAIVFYVSGCPGTSIPGRVATILDTVIDAVQNAQRLMSLGGFAADPEPTSLCQSPRLSALALAGRLMNEVLCQSVESLEDFRQLMKCRNWWPLYENTVYNAMCFSGTDGFAWVTITQFFIVLMAMIALTFRVSLYPIEISEDGGEDAANGGSDQSDDGRNNNTTTAGDTTNYDNMSLETDSRYMQPSGSGLDCCYSWQS